MLPRTTCLPHVQLDHLVVACTVSGYFFCLLSHVVLGHAHMHMRACTVGCDDGIVASAMRLCSVVDVPAPVHAPLNYRPGFTRDVECDASSASGEKLQVRLALRVDHTWSACMHMHCICKPAGPEDGRDRSADFIFLRNDR